MMFKGYRGKYEVDTNTGIVFGRVLDIRAVVTFKSKTKEEAAQAFRDSVDDYLDFCQELGEEPNQPVL
ncbi:MAG: hypothetical protein KME18_01920 [Phormidium tanganyikae FI6-MK23]|jgi:predicted HicB family RNase H-like nuclease|nr:hypothetical protein [Phormidium tanganyikae FI6-MK23]